MTLKVPAEKFSIVVSDEKLPVVRDKSDRSMRADKLRDVPGVEHVPEVEGFRSEKLMASIGLDDASQMDAIVKPMERRTATNRHSEGQQVCDEDPVLYSPDS